jgi:hypothetical protein
MFSMFKKKQRQPDIRDVLFGDLPMSQWPSDATLSDAEPWRSFAKARDHFTAGRTLEAVSLFQRVLAMPGLESRHYVQAWQFLREAGYHPDNTVAKDVLGVIVEVALDEGLDIVVTYADGTARYFNHSGAAVVWDCPDDSLHEPIESLLHAGRVVVEQIGPWEGSRPNPPLSGQVGLNILTPSGLHFGLGQFEDLAGDELGGPIISAATHLMQRLIARTEMKRA